MAIKTRYVSKTDYVGKTAAQLRRLGRSKQIEYVIVWFLVTAQVISLEGALTGHG